MTTKQMPIGSGFGTVSTTNDVIAGIDLHMDTQQIIMKNIRRILKK